MLSKASAVYPLFAYVVAYAVHAEWLGNHYATAIRKSPFVKGIRMDVFTALTSSLAQMDNGKLNDCDSISRIENLWRAELQAVCTQRVFATTLAAHWTKVVDTHKKLLVDKTPGSQGVPQSFIDGLTIDHIGRRDDDKFKTAWVDVSAL